jgi:hypothetical protein
VVAAPGPSLDANVAAEVRATGWPVLVCQDAWRLMPWADKLYGCDARWWNFNNGVQDFKGEKWSTHDPHQHANDKSAEAEKYGIKLVKGAAGSTFSMDPGLIHYGSNSGFQSINLAILLGSPYIVLVGFNMSHKDGKSHFFGHHSPPLYQNDCYENFCHEFDKAAAATDITIINATPDTALTAFPCMSLELAIENGRLHRHGTVTDA